MYFEPGSWGKFECGRQEEKPMFKPGDKARVRSDLVVGRQYNPGKWSFISDVSYLKGKIVTIKSIEEPGVYGVIEEDCWWTDEMLEPVNMVRCDSKDCENNDNGLCPPEKVELIKPVEYDKEGPVIRVRCTGYKKRNNDRELWEKTLEEKFAVIDLKLEQVLGLLAVKCPLCNKYYHLNCAGCPWKEIFGCCVEEIVPGVMDKDGKFGELYDTLERASIITANIISEIRKQIDKC